MTESDRKRESGNSYHESYDSYGDSNGETYESYVRTKSQDEYSADRETDKVDEVQYDRYDSDYETDSTEKQEAKASSCTQKESCCNKGWLSNQLRIV